MSTPLKDSKQAGQEVKNPEKAPGVDANRQQEDSWLTPFLILVITASVSFLTRIIRLGYSNDGTPVFDEKHYAPHAYQMLINGGLEDNPGYGLVVHPPLGKMIMALGESVFGFTPIGWRIMAVLSAVVIVTTVTWMIWKLTHSLGATFLAAVLGNTEVVLTVTSRIGMLDIFLSMFITLGAAFILSDLLSNNQSVPYRHRYRLALAGIMFGCAMAVKVSGVFYPAVAGIIMVITVLAISRNARQTLYALGAGLIFFFIIPSVVFLLSWVPWMGSVNGVSRHSSDTMIQSFLDYQLGISEFHTSLLTSEGHSHPWESKPWHWLVGLRPMLYYTDKVDVDPLIGSGEASEKIWLFTNPAVWFFLIPVAAWMLFGVFKKKIGHSVAFAGMMIGIVPWMIMYDRTMYLFYAAAIAPFLVMGMALTVHDMATWVREYVKKNNKSPLMVNYLYGVVIVVVTACYVLAAPWIYGAPVSDDIHEKVKFFDAVPSATSSEETSEMTD